MQSNNLKFNQSKLYKILKTLNKREFNKLGDYIKSPFFLKNNNEILKLYEAIRENPCFQTSEEILKETLFKKIYPDEVYVDRKMRILLGKTLKIVDSFLLYLENEANEFNRDLQLTRIYRRRNIYSEFANNTKRLLAKLNESSSKNRQFFIDKFNLEREYITHPNTNRNETDELIEANTSFHNYVALEQSRLYLDALNRAKLYQISIELPLVKHDLNLTKDNLNLELINKTNNLLLKTKEEDYEDLKENLITTLGIVDFENSVNTYTVLQNFATSEGHNNPKKYLPKLLELYKLGIHHKLIIINDEILGINYLNIVIVGLRNKEFDWTENFIKNYKSKIKKNERNFIEQLSLAYLYFERKEYYKVINLHLKKNPTNSLFSINIRTIQLRSFYKLFEKDSTFYQPLLKYCEAFEKFLSRDKSLSTLKKSRNKNFSQFVRSIANTIYRNKMNNRRRDAYNNELDRKNEIALKNWLKQILKEKNSPN